MRAPATSGDDAVVSDDDDDQGVLGEALAWTCRMGVRLAVVPPVVLALPSLVRAAAPLALAALAAFFVALPFMFALAVALGASSRTAPPRRGSSLARSDPATSLFPRTNPTSPRAATLTVRFERSR